MPPRAPSGTTPGDRGRGAPRGRGQRGGSRGGPPSGTPSGRGGARGGPPSAGGAPAGSRGGPPGRGRGRAGAPSVPSRTASAITSGPAPPGVTRALPDVSAHITTIGVKRTAFGSNGRALNVFTNHFVTSTPEGNIYHYDGTSLVVFAHFVRGTDYLVSACDLVGTFVRSVVLECLTVLILR